MGIESIFKKLLKRPAQNNTDASDGSEKEDTSLYKKVIRPVIKGVAQSIAAPPPTDERAAALPAIVAPRARRPIGSEAIDLATPRNMESALPAATAAIPEMPAETVPPVTSRPVRPIRPSESTLESINGMENTEVGNEDKGFKSKAWDVLKQSGKGFLQGYAKSGNLGYAAGNAIGGAGAQIVDPSLDEKEKQQKKLAKLYGVYDRQTKTEGEQEKIRRQQADIDNIAADNQANTDKQALLEKKYNLDVDKSLDKKDYDDWHMKNGDAKLSETQNYNNWRRSLGDKKQASDEDYRKWKREADRSALELRKRGLDLQEKRDANNVRIQGQKMDLTREQRAEQTKQYRTRMNLSLAQFKAQLDEKVRTGKLSQEAADQALQDAQ